MLYDCHHPVSELQRLPITRALVIDGQVVAAIDFNRSEFTLQQALGLWDQDPNDGHHMRLDRRSYQRIPAAGENLA